MPEVSSAARVSGKVYRTFEHAGKSYLLSQPLRFASYADEEALILWKRIDPGEFGLRMIQQLKPNYHAAVWEGCARATMAGIPSPEEWAAYNGSQWKMAYMFWQTLDPKHKIHRDSKEPIDLIEGVQWAMGYVTKLPKEKYDELAIKIAFVSQDTAIKNSFGRTGETPEPATNPPTDILDSPDGPPSTNTSETDTDTDPMR